MTPEALEQLRTNRATLVAERKSIDDAVRALDAIIGREEASNGVATKERPPERVKAPTRPAPARTPPVIETINRVRCAPKLHENATIPEKILALLADGEERSIGEISTAIGASYSSTGSELGTMAKKGTLERPRAGIYRRPQE